MVSAKNILVSMLSYELLNSCEKRLRQKRHLGKVGLALFIDLGKAFDTVNHCILLEKLCAYGFRGKFNKLILSYLTNRQQFVVNSNGTSRQQVISYGVPQGSVLGPLFFLTLH